MTKSYHALPTTTLSCDNTFAHPEPKGTLFHLDDPATDAIIDFQKSCPHVCQPSDHIEDVFARMKSLGLHIMLVVEDKTVAGVISSEDILGEKPMQIIQERRVKHSDILVKAVMTKCKQVWSIDAEEIKFAKVGHLLTTLNNQKHHYALIVHSDAEDNLIVSGMVYYYNILKNMDRSLASELREAGSLLELQKRIG
jgi:CBS domain containing-hemolysin-like protein